MSKKFPVLKLETSTEIDGFVRLSPEWFSLDPIAQRDLIGDWSGILDELDAMVREQWRGEGNVFNNLQWRGLDEEKPHEVCRKAILGKRANGQVIDARYIKVKK